MLQSFVIEHNGNKEREKKEEPRVNFKHLNMIK